MREEESSNGLARRRRRRRSSKADDSNNNNSSFISIPTTDAATALNIERRSNDEQPNSSSNNNRLDILLQTASSAMGLTPVHNANNNNNNNDNNNINVTHQSFYTHRRRDSSSSSYHTHPHSLQNHNNRDRNSFELKQNAIHSLQSDGTLEQLSALEHLQSEDQYNSSQNLWHRLAIRSSHPDTSQKELIQRSTFLVISSLTVAAGTLWGLMYVVLGEWMAALMPFIYSSSMSLVLVTFICCKSGDCCTTSCKGGVGRCIDTYDIYVECQLGLIMACPFAVHVALGGVEHSGGVMLWSFLCPMGAAFFRSAKESLIWFWIYLSISGVLLSWEVWKNATAATAEELLSSSGGGTGTNEGMITRVYFLMNIMGCMGVIYSAVFLFARELEKEYTKSEEVLLNILPSKIVKRIKRGEFPIVDHVSSVTILFADLVGFTKASAELHPNFLIGLFLRDVFHAFDELVGKHGLEKIKTIGDAYMVVGGLDHSDGEEENRRRRSSMSSMEGELPSHCDDDDDDNNNGGDHHHPTSIMLLAQDMFHELTRINKKYNLNFSLRIGVHKGPVVAGVLGLKRFTYDVWGDSVNTASRMESNGLPNLIHLSSDMYEAVDGLTNDFEFSCCGEIKVKGKGEMTTYLAKPLR